MPARPKAKPEEVLHDYPEVGKYRVRVVAKAKNGGEMVTALDVREYVKAENFEGFTRRGIRLTTLDEVRTLRDALDDVLKFERIGPAKTDESANAENGNEEG